MFLATPSLLPDESLIKSGAATRHGYGKRCTFSLTDRRLIFKTLYSEDWFPLSHIQSLSRSAIFLHVEFDNRRKEIVSTSDAEEWLALIEQARVNAPEMPYQVGGTPPSAPLLSKNTLLLLVLLAVTSLIGFCAVAFMIIAVVFFLR